MRTQRGKVHEARDYDNPEVRSIDHIATIELGELALDT